MPYAYYIYYRVDPDKSQACEAKVRELLSSLSHSTGINGRLLKKRGEATLWMEVYEPVEDEATFEWELADTANRLGIHQFLQPSTSRHTECFRT